MFTLDEVIKMFEDTWVCPSVDEANEYCEMMVARDAALHYLKMYRSDQIQWEADRKDWQDKWKSYIEARERHLDAVKELKRNDPLSWDELKQMKGKPVWVVEEGYQTWEYWSLVYWMKDDELTLLNENGQMTYSKNEQGTVWQAYRKEHS